MAQRHDLRRLRKVLAFALSLSLLGVYALLGEGDGSAPASDGGDPVAGAARLPDDERDKEKIEIVEVKPTDATPGGVVEVEFINTYKDKKGNLRARLSVTDYANQEQKKFPDLTILHQDQGRLFLQIPREALIGRAKLRVGYDDEHESKPYDIRLRGVNNRKLFREMVFLFPT